MPALAVPILVAVAVGPVVNPDLAPYRAFAIKLEAAVRANDTAAFAGFWDGNALFDRVFAGLDAPEDFRQGYELGAATRLGDVWAEVSRTSGATRWGFRLLRVRAVDGQPRAMFRIVTREGGVNYADLHLTPVWAGGPRVADIDIAVTGEPISRGMTRLARRALTEQRGERVGVTEPDGLIAHSDKLNRLTQLLRENKPKDALKVWDTIPPGLRKEKSLMILRLRIGAALMNDDPAAYRDVIEAFQKRFPNDTAAELLGIDRLFLAGRYDEARGVLRRLDRSVGGDPYIWFLAAGSYLAEGKPAEARKEARRAVKAEPDLLPAHWALVTASLAEQDHAETARLLTHIERKLGQPLTDLRDVPEYAEFVKSPEYRTWMSGRKE